MGIINTSPESFFKKSVITDSKKLAQMIKEMEYEGANFVDVGGMSTAPYLNTLISEKMEIARITRAVKVIQKVSNIPISIDTCRAQVAKAVLELGVDIVNDISGLKYDKDMRKIVEKFEPSLILCAYSKNVVRGNQLRQVRNLIHESLTIAKSVNISSNKIVVDPAIGFFRKSGKNIFFTKINSDWLKRDLLILNNLKLIKQKNPILVSVSRKSFIGSLLKIKNPNERLYGSIAAEVIAVLNGADIIRTHNVRATREAIQIAQKLSSRFRKGL
ncbi:MAG: dihydropteroate synthase [Thaumarchaeota archaeon]|nr:dihydropteroate synthase [Nitrososphaerota archaeon]MBI3642340.1 dihydropteroate synthase [Nitrososphaerota archaeon]